MTELPHAFSDRVLSLLKHPLLAVEARSVACGNSPGVVYVDSVDDPCVALAWSDGIEGFYLAGRPDGADDTIYHTMLDVLNRRYPRKRIASMEVSGCTPELDGCVERYFPGNSSEKETGLIYRLPPDAHVQTVAHPEGSVIQEIDRRFLADRHRKGGLARAKIDLLWGDADAFLGLGVGYCAVLDGEPSAVCLSGFVTDEVHAIDVETLHPYRGRGLTYAVCQAYILHCVNKDFTPHWGCMQENRASRSLAERLGFVQALSYSLLSIPVS